MHTHVYNICTPGTSLKQLLDFLPCNRPQEASCQEFALRRAQTYSAECVAYLKVLFWHCICCKLHLRRPVFRKVLVVFQSRLLAFGFCGFWFLCLLGLLCGIFAFFGFCGECGFVVLWLLVSVPFEVVLACFCGFLAFAACYSWVSMPAFVNGLDICFQQM